MKSLLLIKDDTSEIAGKTSALIYTLAEKFLDGNELTDIKEVFRMTRLGQMLVNDGIDEGRKEGIQAGVSRVITAMLKKGKTISDIAADTDISEDEIRKIQRSMQKNK